MLDQGCQGIDGEDVVELCVSHRLSSMLHFVFGEEQAPHLTRTARRSSGRMLPRTPSHPAPPRADRAVLVVQDVGQELWTDAEGQEASRQPACPYAMALSRSMAVLAAAGRGGRAECLQGESKASDSGPCTPARVRGGDDFLNKSTKRT